MIDNIIIGLYFIVILLVGMYQGKDVKNLKDYSVGGKGFNTFAIFATLSASFIGGGFSIGNAENVYKYGIVSILVLFGFSLQQFLVAKYIVPSMKKYKDAISVGDIIEKSYGKKAKIWIGIISVVVCSGILGVQISAIGYIFSLFTNIDRIYGILIGCTIVILYSASGGMKSVVMVDVIQFILLIIAMPLVLLAGIKYVGGFENIIAIVPNEHLNIFGYHSMNKIISMFLIFLVGEALVPPYILRLLLTEDINKVKKATIWSSLLSVIFFIITGLTGLVALSINGSINPNLALPYVIKTVLPVGITALVVAGMMAIVMSTADSFLNATIISIVNDIFYPIYNKKLSDRNEIRLTRILTVSVGIIGITFAIFNTSIIELLSSIYTLWAPIVVVPLILGIREMKVSSKRFFIATPVTISIMIIWKFGLGSPGDISTLIVGFVCNLFIYLW